MNQILQFLLDNPILSAFIVLGLLGNLGSSAAGKKQRERKRKRREEERARNPLEKFERKQADEQAQEAAQPMAQPMGQSTGQPRAQEPLSSEDLGRKIRQLFESGPVDPNFEDTRPPAPVPPPGQQRVKAARKSNSEGSIFGGQLNKPKDNLASESVHSAFREIESLTEHSAGTESLTRASALNVDLSLNSSFDGDLGQSIGAGDLLRDEIGSKHENSGSLVRQIRQIGPSRVYAMLMAFSPPRAMSSHEEDPLRLAR